MLVKIADAKVSADGAEGVFVGYASTWTRQPDSYGDVVAQGAFTRTLKEWADSGRPIPVLWGHDMHDPFSNVGVVIEANQDDRGLKITGQLDLENPTAMQVFRLIKSGAVAQMSFAFDIDEDAVVTLPDGQKVRELREVTLYEVSIVPIGANQDTSIDEVKSGGGGERLTADEVRAVRLLLAKSAPEEGEADGNSGTAAEDLDGVKAAGLVEAAARITQEIDALR